MVIRERPHQIFDEIAEKGILFENAYSPVPVTLPAHSSMLTGTIPPFHGVHDNFNYRLPQSIMTIAEILRQNSFITGAIVSAFVLDSKFGIDQGFDDYDDRFESKEHAIIDERDGEETSLLAIEWLEKNKNSCFFLFLHYFDPHQAYEPPEPFYTEFKNDLYAGEIAYTDYCIGKIFNSLKDLGLDDSTLIVITSDHGEMLGEHGEPTHSYFIYQSAIKVPLIFRLPDSITGRSIQDPVGIIDIVPTICNLLEIEVPDKIQGKDLSEYFTKKQRNNQERHFYCESLIPTKYSGNSLLGVVANRWKYIQTTRPELYDILEDPGETNNLILNQAHIADVLRTGLQKILADTIRNNHSERKMVLNEKDKIRLESLGYVGNAGVNEIFNFDNAKEDPKELISFHNLTIKADLFTRQKKYVEAKIICEKMLSEQPEYFGTYVLLSKIAKSTGDFLEAVSWLKEIIKVQPAHDDALCVKLNLAGVYTDLGSAYWHLEDPDEAIKNFNEALRIDPNLEDAQFNLGFVLEEQGKTVEAIDHYSEALKINPDHKDANVKMGMIFSKQGELEKAIHHYSEALRIYHNQPLIHYEIALLLLKKGDLEKAGTHFRQVIQLRPGFMEAYYNLGNIVLKQERLEEAVAFYSKALDLSRGNSGIHLNLGVVFYKKGQIKEAVYHLREASKLDPGNPTLSYTLGNIFMEQKNYHEAKAKYEKAIAIQPNYTSALNKLAAVYSIIGNCDQAINLLHKLIEFNPESPRLYYNLACNYAKKMEVEKSIEFLKKAIDKGYNNWELLQNDEDLTNIRSSLYYKELVKER